jgi:hypothetical protein
MKVYFEFVWGSKTGEIVFSSNCSWAFLTRFTIRVEAGLCPE